MPSDGEGVRAIGTYQDSWGCGYAYGAFDEREGWGWGDGWCDSIAWGDALGGGGAPINEGPSAGDRRPMWETTGAGADGWFNNWYDDQQE